jgi:triosephosphate isomerase (TIM)
MRKKIVAGNWKMNTDLITGGKLASEIGSMAEKNPKLKNKSSVEMIICPPFVFIPDCLRRLEGISPVHVGAQNCHSEEKGAYTGEVSAAMLHSMGAEYVIIGHSERRQYFKEDHLFLQKKVVAALHFGLKPIFCCGEVIAEREAGKHFDIVRTQIRESLFDLTEQDFAKIIIAYEPVWAIGTGITATPAQAQEMHAFIRQTLEDKYGKKIAADTIILYGGSCNAKNAKELFAMPDIDGGLIGGASLKADEFIEIAIFAAEA